MRCARASGRSTMNSQFDRSIKSARAWPAKQRALYNAAELLGDRLHDLFLARRCGRRPVAIAGTDQARPPVTACSRSARCRSRHGTPRRLPPCFFRRRRPRRHGPDKRSVHIRRKRASGKGAPMETGHAKAPRAGALSLRDGVDGGHTASFSESRTRFLGMSPRGEIAFPVTVRLVERHSFVNWNPTSRRCGP